MALQQQVQAAIQQLCQAVDSAQQDAALLQVAAARAALRAHEALALEGSARVQRQQWLHNGERPHPSITEQLRALETGDGCSHSGGAAQCGW